MEALSTIGGVVSLVGQANNIYRWLTGSRASRDPRVTRWNMVARAHGFDAFTLCERLGFGDVSPAVATSPETLAIALDSARLRAAASALNVRYEWLLGIDHRPYDLVSLDRSFGPLLRELDAWKNTGEGHSLLAFKCGRESIEDLQRQSGALVLARCDSDHAEYPLYAFRPVYTLQSWGEPTQRWRAFRMMWAARHLEFAMRGYDATEKQCDGLREGTLFPGTLRRCWGVGTWHPDDYVVRPSMEAKGDDAVVEAFERECGDELLTLARAAGRDV